MNPDYLYLIGQAVKAPSGHNTQPWLFRVEDGGIEILPDLSKTLPIVDPDRRELFISVGCAAENLCLAAAEKGYGTEVAVAAEGSLRIALHPENRGSGSASLPGGSIDRRQTNRGVYTGRRVEEEQMASLTAAAGSADVRIMAWPQGSAAFEQVAGYVYEGNYIQLGDAGFRKELKAWMRFNSRHARQTNDGLTYAVFGAPDLPRWISEPVIATLLNGASQNKGDRKKIASSSHLILFASAASTPAAWIELGRRFENFLLRAAGAGLAVAFLNQPCEVPHLAEKLQREGLSAGYRPQLLLRIGYAARPAAFSPRRPVAEFLV